MAMRSNQRKKKAPQKKRSRKTALQASADKGEAPPGLKVKPVAGSLVSAGDLILQGTKLVAAARLHEALLAGGNWPKERTDALAVQVTQLKVAAALAKAELKRRNAAYRATVSKTRAFRTRLAAKLRVAALAKPGVLKVTPLPRGRMRNAMNLMQWLIAVQGPMKALRAELAHESPNVDWFARLEEETQTLGQAMGAKEVRKSQRASRADARVAQTNELVTSMEELRTRARDVFVDKPLVLKEFTKWTGLKRKRAKSIQSGDTNEEARGTSNSPAEPPAEPQSTATTGAPVAVGST